MYVKIGVQKRAADDLDRLICCTRVQGGYHDYHTHSHTHAHKTRTHQSTFHNRQGSVKQIQRDLHESKETYMNQKIPIYIKRDLCTWPETFWQSGCMSRLVVKLPSDNLDARPKSPFWQSGNLDAHLRSLSMDLVKPGPKESFTTDETTTEEKRSISIQRRPTSIERDLWGGYN